MRFVALFWLVLPLAASSAPQSAVQGKVLDDATGAPLPGVTVTFRDDGPIRSGETQVTVTDDSGAFEFADPISRHYILSFEKRGFLTESVSSGRPPKDTVVRLRQPGSISGRILDDAGEPIGKALVEVMTKSYRNGEASLQGVSRGFEWTDSGGMYQISELAPGTYYVRASRAGYGTILYPNASDLMAAQNFEIMAGDAKDDVDFRMRQDQGFTAEGWLIDGETGLPAAAKFLRAYSHDWIMGTFVDGSIRDGHFQLKGLRSGRYSLNFSWVGPTNNETRNVAIPLEIGQADQTGIVLTAVAPTTVAGRLIVKGGILPHGLSVGLGSVDPTIHDSGGSSAAGGDVAEDGSFKITRLEAGEYRLRVHSPDSPHFYVHERDTIIVAGAPLTGIELVGDFSAGTVSGRAVDRDGSPILDALVVLQSTDLRKSALELYRHVSRVGVEGRYSVSGVAPGEYLLYVWRGEHDLIGNPDLFLEAIKAARRVTVTPGSEIQMDATEIAEPR